MTLRWNESVTRALTVRKTCIFFRSCSCHSFLPNGYLTNVAFHQHWRHFGKHTNGFISNTLQHREDQHKSRAQIRDTQKHGHWQRVTCSMWLLCFPNTVGQKPSASALFWIPFEHTSHLILVRLIFSEYWRDEICVRLRTYRNNHKSKLIRHLRRQYLISFNLLEFIKRINRIIEINHLI